MSSESTPFQIAVSDAQLSVLQQKLALTTLPDEIDDAGWSYGTPLADMQRLINRWKNGYDWRKEEAKLNAEMPQFTRDIDVEGFGTLNIHYVYKRSKVEGAIPLLFIHGCTRFLLHFCQLSLRERVSCRARELHRSPEGSAFIGRSIFGPPDF
jgi:Epoxide hydrolase N terminus